MINIEANFPEESTFCACDLLCRIHQNLPHSQELSATDFLSEISTFN